MHRKTGTRKNFCFFVLCRNRRMAINATNGPSTALQRSVPSEILHASVFALLLSDAKSRNAVPLKRTMRIPRTSKNAGSGREISPYHMSMIVPVLSQISCTYNA